jgi:hypothetical protein
MRGAHAFDRSGCRVEHWRHLLAASEGNVALARGVFFFHDTARHGDPDRGRPAWRRVRRLAMVSHRGALRTRLCGHTRLERIFDDGTSKPANERWVSTYPEAASLRWIVDSPAPYLPVPGRYRILLVAFSGGRVTVPFAKQLWGWYGNFTDRFGVQWAVLVNAAASHSP